MKYEPPDANATIHTGNGRDFRVTVRRARRDGRGPLLVDQYGTNTYWSQIVGRSPDHYPTHVTLDGGPRLEIDWAATSVEGRMPLIEKT